MTAGTMLLMWLGEQITQRGIGNGVSLLITIGILAQFPGARRHLPHVLPAGRHEQRHGLPDGGPHDRLFLAVTMGIIMVVQGQRKIPVQYAKRVVGNKVMGGQSSFLPLKVNYSGVMPSSSPAPSCSFPSRSSRRSARPST
jgi:preprotein translocase subunit SecY